MTTFYQSSPYLVLNLIFESLPEELSISGLSDVCEDGVLHAGQHSVRVRLHVRARAHTEKPGLRVDTIQLSILIKPHPGNVITCHSKTQY